MIWTEDTKFFVIVNHYDADVSWASRLKLPYIIYEKEQSDKEPFSAANKAKSETNLLKFIYEFYDKLPKNIITVHQYEFKFYHQGSLVEILNDIELYEKYKKSTTKGFYAFNDFILGNIEPQISKMLESGWWPKTMEPYFGKIKEYGNFTLGKRGCSQFIVSRKRIHSLPQQFYKNMYNWLVNNTLDQPKIGFNLVDKTRLPDPIDKSILSNYHTSRYMEWSWELIFTSVKRNEKLSVTIYKRHKFYALYGALSYFVNVTDIFLDKFVDDKIIEISSNIKFNDFFGDPISGETKSLFIVVNNVNHIIKEDRKDDVLIKLG